MVLAESMAAELLAAQVGRETEVDCALAELYVRTMATDRLVKDTAQAEIFNSIFSRMNEVRDMLHGKPPLRPSRSNSRLSNGCPGDSMCCPLSSAGALHCWRSCTPCNLASAGLGCAADGGHDGHCAERGRACH